MSKIRINYKFPYTARANTKRAYVMLLSNKVPFPEIS